MKAINKNLLAVVLFGAIPVVFVRDASAQLSFANGDFVQGVITTVNTYEKLSTSTISGWVDGPEWSGTPSYVSSAPGIGYDFVFTRTSTGATASFNDNPSGFDLINSATQAGAKSVPLPVAGYSGNMIAADGAYQQSALQQTITGLIVGDSYQVSFYYGGSQQAGYTGTTTEQWAVNLSTAEFVNNAGQLNTTGATLTPLITLKGSSGSYASDFSGWMSDTIDFKATSTSEILGFFAEGGPPGEPPFDLLADVGFTLVPEPSTIFAGGLLMLPIGIHAWRTLRRKSKVPANTNAQ